MKIFFHAPITERMYDTNLKYYRYMEKLGHQHTSRSFSFLTPKRLLDKNYRKRAQKFLKSQDSRIKNSDVVIFGATEQSIGIGYFMHIAISFSKPIIALCEKFETIPFHYESLSFYDKLLIYECNLQDYKKVISEALDDAAKLIDKRFTLLMPPMIVEHLEKHHQQTGVSRSEYIRDLIMKDIKKK